METVKLRVENDNDLFNAFNPDEDIFTDEVKSYIFRHLEKEDIAHQISIQFLSAQPLNEDRIKRAMDAWIREEKEDLRKTNKENMSHQFWMLGIGIVFLVLSISLQSKADVIWSTILSAISSLAIWEAVNIWIVQNPKLLKIKRNIEKMEKNVKISVAAEK